MNSSLDLLDFAFFISAVIKGLLGRERQEVVFCGACLSRSVERIEETVQDKAPELEPGMFRG